MFNFEVSEIEFGLASRQQPDARAFLGKSQSQPLADASTRASDQHARMSQ
jgi:hypothetical protein